MSGSDKNVPGSIMNIGDVALEWVNSYKYLGILINANEDFVPIRKYMYTWLEGQF